MSDVKKLNCSIKPIIQVTFNKPTNDSITDDNSFKSGCAYLDVYFTQNTGVHVHDICFKNYYTYEVMVLGRITDSAKLEGFGKGGCDDERWKVCVPWTRLMLSAHLEHGAEECHSLKSHMTQPILQHLSMLRIYMKQPSYIWKEFRLENVQCYGEVVKLFSASSSANSSHSTALTSRSLSSSSSSSLPSWFLNSNRDLSNNSKDSSNNKLSTASMDLSENLLTLFTNFTTHNISYQS